MFNDDGQREQQARPELSSPHYICMYRLLPTTPHHRLGIINLDLSPVPVYRPQNDGQLVSQDRLYAHKLCPRFLHNLIQRHQKKMNPGCRVQDQLNTSEPTAPYIKARKINLSMCWVIGESNPGPFARAASGLTSGIPKPLKYVGVLVAVLVQIHQSVMLY